MSDHKKPTDPVGVAAARAYAHWHLGDPSWADHILNAYFNPEAIRDELQRERNS